MSNMEAFTAINQAKELVVGRGAGRVAQALRNSWVNFKTPREQAGTRANDQMAEYIVTRLCKPDAVFVDGGAHIGSIMAGVRLHCPRSRIVAVEAIPPKAERLARRFPDAEVFNCALTEVSGDVSFFIDIGHTARSSLAKQGGLTREIRVPGRRLDDLPIAETVDVIKLDLEGAELGALYGGKGLIERCRPAIMFESGPTDLLGYTKEGLADWFVAHDYEVFAPVRLAHSAPSMSREVFLDAHEYPFTTLNYFAIPSERLAEYRERVRRICYRLP